MFTHAKTCEFEELILCFRISCTSIVVVVFMVVDWHGMMDACPSNGAYACAHLIVHTRTSALGYHRRLLSRINHSDETQGLVKRKTDAACTMVATHLNTIDATVSSKRRLLYFLKTKAQRIL